MFKAIRSLALAAAVAGTALAAVPANAADEANRNTFWDIQRHLGVVPKFFQLFPEAALTSTWTEFKNLELSTDTAIDVKTKELIALAVSVQASCPACIYFHSAAATANGASGKEIQEAVGLAVMTGTWSKVLTNQHADIVKKDTNVLLSIGKLTAKPAAIN